MILSLHGSGTLMVLKKQRVYHNTLYACYKYQRKNAAAVSAVLPSAKAASHALFCRCDPVWAKIT